MALIRTKIVCTIGPSVGTVEKLIEMIHAGMNVARLNFSHGTHEEHLANINNIKKAREITDTPVAIMLDTKGPEIRIGQIPSGHVQTHAGMRLKLVEKENGHSDEIPVHPFDALSAVVAGMAILFDDGYIVSKVLEKKKNAVVIEIQYPGVLKSGKKVNIPDACNNLPALTSEDIQDLRFGCAQDIDLVAASFVRSTHHVLAIKELLAKEGKPDILVIAKIENHEGVKNFDSIVQVADGIMVARGDLGVELDLALVPKLQKMMIRKCYQACKPVVTATQMLESMIVNPRPTRAEVSDVANAIYDCSSSVMLSGETATGKYPIETVQQMKRIIEEAEADFDYREFFKLQAVHDYHDAASALSRATVQTAYGANVRAIFAFTTSGRSARFLSRLRPEMPILALTPNRKVYQQLSFNWGIIPIYCPTCTNVREAFHATSVYALKHGLIAFGDVVVVLAGTPFGKKGSTNMMLIENIGEVVVRGNKGVGMRVQGKVSILLSSEGVDPETLRGQLVVILRCDNTFLPALKHAAGIILQNFIGDNESESCAAQIAQRLNIPMIGRADGAVEILNVDETVTLDPHRGLIYRGGEEYPAIRSMGPDR
ncbi:MAG: pyruvate kinase [Parachlamydiales bacterium]|nr:pyruvate kinase [Parachlamydiales bacterium]